MDQTTFDVRAAGAFFESLRPFLTNLLRGRLPLEVANNPDELADVLGDVCVAFLDAADRRRIWPGAERAFLVVIALRAAYHRGRRCARDWRWLARPEATTNDEGKREWLNPVDTAPSGRPFDAALLSCEARALCERVRRLMGPEAIDLLLRREVEGASYEDLAAHFARRPEALRKQMERIRARLAEPLEQEIGVAA